MKNALGTRIPEEHIQRRSYEIWETDGCQQGRDEEYWLRALAELEEELERSWQAALAPDATTDVVMPHFPVSQIPTRSESGRIDPNTFREAA